MPFKTEKQHLLSIFLSYFPPNEVFLKNQNTTPETKNLSKRNFHHGSAPDKILKKMRHMYFKHTSLMTHRRMTTDESLRKNINLF